MDEGFGLPVRRLVVRAGATDPQRLQYMMSPQVQQCIVTAFKASAVSSLPAERAFAELKRSEAPRLCHVATAGRNAILRLHLRQRSAFLEEAEVAAAALRQSLQTNLQSMAFQLRPDLAAAALQGQSSEL